MPAWLGRAVSVLVAGRRLADPGLHLPQDACAGKLSVPEQFDLVITWWASGKGLDYPPELVQRTEQLRAAPRGGNVLIDAPRGALIDAGFQNYNEIKYGLRSFKQNGLLDFVRRVYVLVDSSILDEFGPPASLDFDTSAGLDLRLLTDTDLGLAGGGHACSVKLARLAQLEDLSPWFVHVPDDLLLLGRFTRELFFPPGQPPVMHTYGTYQDWCDGQAGTGSRHGPTVFNKCYLGLVAEEYSLVHPPPGENRDTICLYYHAATSAGVAQSGGGYGAGNFFRECHTNGGGECHSLAKADDYFKDGIIFLNLQGPGISDEYGGNQGEAADFFHSHWPTPEAWERSASSTAEVAARASPSGDADELRSERSIVVLPDGTVSAA